MARAAVELLSPVADLDWRHAKALIDELIEWDVSQSARLGFDRAAVVDAFYPDSLESIRRNSAGPDGRFLLATANGGAAGCAAFRRLDSEVCELYNVYVRSTRRGCGIGSLLVGTLQKNARGAGYGAMYLETATFMHGAHKLYRSHQFEVCEHYRSVPEVLAGAIISMRCNLLELTESLAYP